jgi:penicillin-binding protein 1A
MRVTVGNPRTHHPLAILVRLATFGLVVAGLAAGIVGAAAYGWFARDLPPIPPYEAIRVGAVSQVRSLHGMLLAERFGERRYLVARDGLPQALVDAVLASEDERFFEHGGTDLRGIARAMWTNLRAGSVKEGASTITQQVARALLLGRERSITRKVREAILARRIEDIYTKDQILTLYLNLIFLGNGAYGVQAASRVYFGKDLDELTVGEAATLAALPQSPGKVNPRSDPVETKVRRDRVLRRMLETGRITEPVERLALAEEVRTTPVRDPLGDRAPYAAMDALDTIASLADARAQGGLLTGAGGVTAWTTVDLGLQRVADEAVLKAARALSRRQGWPGPVARLDAPRQADFRTRNQAWLARRGWERPPVGAGILALVTAVSKAEARLDIGTGTPGRIPLERMRWATPYDEFPVINARTGERRESGKVSLDGRLDAVDRALHAGDVVLVRRLDAPKAAPKAAPDPAPAAVDEYDLDLFPRPEAALLALEPRSGYVPALSGGTDFDNSQVDRTRSVRQTGSNVKPLYYSKAYDLGIAPSAVLSGAPFREGDWTPETGKSAEDLTLWEALTRSENAVSLRVFRTVLDRVGVEGLNDWAVRLGWTRPFQGFPAEALGADGTAFDLLRAYAAFAARGITPEPVRVAVVRDAEGRILLDNRSPRDPTVGLLDAIAREVASADPAARRAASAETAYVVAANLRSVAERGTGRATHSLGRPVCGKTGTLPYDVWFTGWTHEIAAVAWVGQDRHERWLGRTKANGKVFGADTALPVWKDFVAAATAGRPVVDDLATPPAGVVMVAIDPVTGAALATGGIPVPHLAGTEPPPAGMSGMPPDLETSEF